MFAVLQRRSALLSSSERRPFFGPRGRAWHDAGVLLVAKHLLHRRRYVRLPSAGNMAMRSQLSGYLAIG